MPAMPKEKATAVSLNENPFTELKLKLLATSTVVVAPTVTTTVAMATTPSGTASAIIDGACVQQNDTSIIQQQAECGTCGCGAASIEMGAISNSVAFNANELLSPSALAAAAHRHTAKVIATTQRSTSTATCNRTLYGSDTSTITSVDHCSRSTNSMDMSRVLDAISATANSEKVGNTPPKKSPKDFIFGKYIGEGSFSVVYLAVDINTKREYAIKVCEKRHILREHKQEYIRRERKVMNMMTNVPGFVNLSCTFQDSRSLYFVMTYAKNGDLLPYINKVGSFDVDCTRHYAAELVLACEQMHSRNIVHRDLKPENILLDEKMHTLIADFGSAKILLPEDRTTSSATTMYSGAHQFRTNSAGGNNGSYTHDDVTPTYNPNDTESDDVDTPSRQQRFYRKRKGSFVGTAQYVSPEVLQNGLITAAADLWALGCIIYQMISGLPPFRGSNDYIIFKEILACNLQFPHGFDKDAEDLVRQLLKVNPDDRLGAKDGNGRYDSIRLHPFFTDVNFDTVPQQTPPPIYPYLPGVSKVGDFRSQYRVPENLEPGLDDKQLTRLLGVELGTAVAFEKNGVTHFEKKSFTKNIFDLTDAEKLKCLAQQQFDKWHVFADNEVILKKGYVNKRKGLFARKRMLLLTTGPRLIYIDPVQMVKKGEIPWSPELRVEPKNFKIFFVHTPNRTYYLEDPEGYSLDWVDSIEKMRVLTYHDLKSPQASHTYTTSTTSSSPTSMRVKLTKAVSNSN